MPQTLGQARVVDPVITPFIHGYCNAESIAPFVAPIVPVTTRAGKIIKFTKEQFAVLNTRRAPGGTIKRISTNFTNESYFIEQHAIAGEVTIEQYEEALNGEAQLDLRVRSAMRAAAAVDQSWELEVVNTITNAALYETNNQEVLAGTDQWSDPSSDPEVKIQEWKEQIRSQIGCYPNKLIVDTASYNALKFHPIFRDRIKYTSTGTINSMMLADWFGLPGGVRIAQRVQLDPATGALTDIMPAGTAVLLYAPMDTDSRDANGGTFMPVDTADRATPSAFYTYQLSGYPIAGVERFDDDRQVYLTDVIAEQSIQPVGLGETGLVGAAFLGTSTIA